MTQNEFNLNQELEKQRLLMVDLPSLIQKILHLSMIPLPLNNLVVNKTVEEIKKITNAECENALSYLKN